MIFLVIPGKYIKPDNQVSAPTDGYTVNEDWLCSELLDWIIENNVSSLSYDSMTTDFFLRFWDEELAMQFKLTFPP